MVTQPFVWAGNTGERARPEDLARQRTMAEQLVFGVGRRSPQSIGEGLSSAVSSIAAALMGRDAGNKLKAGQQEYGQLVEALAGGDPNTARVVLAHPFATPGGSSLASTILAAEQKKTDPLYQAQLTAAQQKNDPLFELNAKAQAAGFMPGTPEYQAFVKDQALGAAAVRDPAAVQEYRFFAGLTPEQQQTYLTVKRANPNIDLGNVIVQRNPVNPSQTMGALPVGTAPKTQIDNGQVVQIPGMPGVPVAAPVAGPSAPAAAPGGPVQVPAYPAPQRPPVNVPVAGPGGIVTTPLPSTVEKEKKAAAEQKKYADIVTEDVDRAIGLIEKSKWPVTGTGSYLSVIPGTAASDLSSLLSTLKANAGFDRLQAMRAASPTGGALGNVSDSENKMLQATIGSLEQSQTKEQLTYNLRRFQDLYLDIIHGPGNRPNAGGAIANNGTEGWSIQRVQ